MTDSSGQRIAIVTGASQGIGQSICEVFRANGILPIGISREIEPSESTRRCDVRNERDVSRVFDEIAATFGRIDILVNNAAMCTYTDFMSVEESEWDDTLAVNVKGAAFCAKHALRHMLKRSYGKIVSISSIAGRNRSIVASVPYTCSKYAIIGMTRQLALHYAQHNININCVCPSQTVTPMLSRAPKEKIDALVATIPARRLGNPEEVAECVLFLCSDKAAYVNGAVLDINGAQL